jgi:homoserine acetyltransferase
MFLRKVEKRPKLLVLSEPVGTFSISCGELFLARWFWWSYKLIKPLLKYYIKVRRVNSEGDYEMYRIICRALDAAHPRKLALTIAGISGYSIYPALSKIDVPVIVIGTSLDKFHGNNEQEDIARSIKGAEYHDLENNIRSHSAEVAEIIRKYPERF